MSPDAALAACRFLHDGSAMLLWGASAYLSTLVPGNLARDIGQRLRSFLIVTGILAVATTATVLPLEAAFLGDGWGDAFRGAMLQAVLLETSVGHVWLMQAVAALLLAAALAISPADRQAATALASGLLLACLALTGHAVMREGWPGAAQRVNDLVHILSAGAWLGALVVLLPVLGALNDPTHRLEAGTALRRFSAAGHLVVALVIASGVVNSLLVLQRWPTDWSSPYQAMLASKVALVAVMIGLALFNRYGLVPQLVWRPSPAVIVIRYATFAEIGLGLCAVALVAVFGMLEPA